MHYLILGYLGTSKRRCCRGRIMAMIQWALIFLVVAIVAAVLGFTGIAGTAAWIAKVLFVVFVILFVVSLLMGRRAVP